MKFLHISLKWLLIFIAAITCLLTAHPSEVSAQGCLLPKPSNLQLSNISSCQATLSWNAVAGASYYGVKFRVQGTTAWSAVVKIGLNTSYTFTGLSASTAYNFAVASYCSNNRTSGSINIKGTTSACSAPTISQVTVVDPFTVTISWQGCPSSFNQIRFRKLSDTTATFLSTGTAQSVTLNNLTSNASYVFQVNACADTGNSWSAADTFHLQQRPNILLIILDDARYDSYSCNGGPSFFHSINIDRIANEGVNFKNDFCVESYCIPSRGSIVTGLYPHKNGATNNSAIIYPYLPTTAKILDSAGYYTAWIGKYHMSVKPQAGYEYWFATKVNSGTDEYNNMVYNYNGKLKVVPGHDTDILTDTMLAFLDKNGTKNFFATLAYHAPHQPFIPQDQYNGIFDEDQMPVPSDTAHYQSNYPTFLYHLPQSFYIQPSNILIQYPKYFELLAGVDDAIGKILQKLTDLGVLDNTMIIFTSDNGIMFGEHGLFEKRFAYDPSTRTPLFIRYPAWFADSTIITNQMALNVDIAPTILEAAGIHGNYSFDGVSLKKLADNTVTRTSMYYEYLYDPYTVQLPFMRSVRTFSSKLTDYGCDQQTEEFFNLSTDSREDTNQINNASYAAIIQDLKNQFSNFKIQFADTAVEHGLICHLKPSDQKDATDLYIDEESIPLMEDNILLYPDPAADLLTFAFVSLQKDQPATILISNVFGTVVQQESINITEGENIQAFALKKELSSGSYFFTIITNSERMTKPLMIEK